MRMQCLLALHSKHMQALPLPASTVQPGLSGRRTGVACLLQLSVASCCSGHLQNCCRTLIRGTLWQGTCQAILVCRNDDAVGLLGGTLHHLTPLLVHLQLGSALAQLRHREIKCTCILGLSMCNLGLRPSLEPKPVKPRGAQTASKHWSADCIVSFEDVTWRNRACHLHSPRQSMKL